MRKTIEQAAKAGLIYQQGRLLLLFDYDVNRFLAAELNVSGIFHLPDSMIMPGSVRCLKKNRESMVLSGNHEIYGPGDRYFPTAHSIATDKTKGKAVNPRTVSRVL